MITQIGFLRKGDVFRFEGDIYKVGHLLESTNGYVSCIDVNTGKKKRLHIDVDVEIEQANWNLLKGVKQSEVFKQEEMWWNSEKNYCKWNYSDRVRTTRYGSGNKSNGNRAEIAFIVGGFKGMNKVQNTLRKRYNN